MSRSKSKNSYTLQTVARRDNNKGNKIPTQAEVNQELVRKQSYIKELRRLVSKKSGSGTEVYESGAAFSKKAQRKQKQANLTKQKGEHTSALQNERSKKSEGMSKG
jgi:hypothetical protein